MSFLLVFVFIFSVAPKNCDLLIFCLFVDLSEGHLRFDFFNIIFKLECIFINAQMIFRANSAGKSQTRDACPKAHLTWYV